MFGHVVAEAGCAVGDDPSEPVIPTGDMPQLPE